MRRYSNSKPPERGWRPPISNIQYPISNIQYPTPVDLAVLHQPLAAINVGLESFAESLVAQDAPVVQVDWQPPAGGNEKLMAILERMGRRDEGR
jgi:FdrA protein